MDLLYGGFLGWVFTILISNFVTIGNGAIVLKYRICIVAVAVYYYIIHRAKHCQANTMQYR